MEFRNFTPFPGLQFESRSVERKDFGVVVVRGSFEIHYERPLKPLREQEPLVFADVYRGEPGESSLRMENSIAPFKPRSDIHIDAIAYSPRGRPRPYWPVDVSIGKLSKRLVVTGERYWQHRLGMWRLTDFEPCSEVPVCYELAYGGTRQTGDDAEVAEANPVGLGFADPRDHKALIRVPRILPFEQLEKPKFGEPLKVEGLGPIAPAWQPRLAHAGRFDLTWEKTRWPDLPGDFRFDFYNSAHPDMVYPGFLQGDESVLLRHLTPEGRMEFTLPGYEFALLVRREDGIMLPMPALLDTLHLDMPNRRAYLTWRGIFSMSEPVRAVEARMRVKNGTSTQAA